MVYIMILIENFGGTFDASNNLGGTKSTCGGLVPMFTNAKPVQGDLV